MNAKIYPGMVDQGVEFFLNGSDFKIIQSGNIKCFNEISFPISQILIEEISKVAAVENALFEMHPDSKRKRIEQFAKCRFGGLDLQADIVDGVVQDGEYWACPFHGSCKHEGILCKLPVYNGSRLTKSDVVLMQQSCSDKTNDVIADDLQMAHGTFHQSKKYLHRKLGVQTKQAIAIIALKLNIL